MKTGTILRSIALLSLLTSFGCGSDDESGPQAEVLPIVFVHGQSGSAQQFESQAMRFTSNGYPQEMLFAFEYSTAVSDNPLADLDAFIADVLATTGAAQIYAIGHSRGTSVWTEYLADPSFDGPSLVARYVNIDGRSPAELPGGVPTIGIWGEWNTAGSPFNRRENNDDAQIGPFPDDNYYFADKSHTETTTSAEAFAFMYEFLTGVAAQTANVSATPAGDPVDIAGRVLIFPQNEGYTGSRVQIWRVEANSGQRTEQTPEATFDIAADGNFGPVTVESGAHYEFAVLRPATATFPMESVHHLYVEPFTHDNYFVRLLTSPPGEGIGALIPSADDATGLLVIRQRELWGDQGGSSDELLVNGLNILTPSISPRATGAGSGVNIAIFAYDDESDKMTDLSKGELSPFSGITFLTAADIYLPATPDGSMPTEVVLVTRGVGEKRIYVPNRPSTLDRNTVMFRDDTE